MNIWNIFLLITCTLLTLVLWLPINVMLLVVIVALDPWDNPLFTPKTMYECFEGWFVESRLGLSNWILSRL
jgi:hypothetical protein